MIRFAKRKPIETANESDQLKLRILRQQIQANETNLMLGMVTEKEYGETLARLNAEVSAMESKYEIGKTSDD